MAGSSMTITVQDQYGPITVVRAAWVSDSATGAVTGTTTFKCIGEFVKAVTVPGTGGAAPDANYDIVVNDADGANVLAQCDDDLTDRHTSNTETIHCLIDNAAGTAMALHPIVNSTLEIAVTNAGNSNEGELIMYFKKRW